MWLLTFAGALIVMSVLQRVTDAAPVEARAALALGFLLIVAQAGGEMVRLLKAPRVLGVLLAAIAVGPSGLGLVRPDELAGLQIVSSGALALLAYLAGSALQRARLRSRDDAVAFSRLTAGVMLAPFLVVAGVTLSIAPWFPLTAHQPVSDALTIALFLGAAAAISSPLLVLPVVEERAGSDAFSRQVLDLSIAQDVAAVGLIALVLGATALVATPGAAQPGVLGHTMLLLGGSLAAGAALGYGISRLRVVLPERAPVALLAMAALVGVGTRWVELEPTLLGLAAGIVAATTARGGGLPGSVPTLPARLVVPVAVALFAARLDLGVLRNLWPWVLLFAGLRITALRAGLLWAGRDRRVTGTVVERGWLGLIGQAGVALTLASIARRVFPEWGISLEALLVAMIGVHAVAGPVLFDWVLGLTREGPEEPHDAKNGLAVAGRDRRGGAGL